MDSVSTVLLFFKISIFITSFASKTTLFAESACGDIGVTRISSAFGLTIGPPAERLYPVEPVGVETITRLPHMYLKAVRLHIY